MTTFWIICALLLAVALLFIVLPLWRSTAKNNLVERDAANLEIFRDQLAEMDADLRNGLLTPELYEQGKRELQARLLEEVKNPDAANGTVARDPQKALALILVLVFPLAAVGMYWRLGNFDAFLPQSELAKMAEMGGPHSGEVLKELEDRLAKEPNDVQGWAMLARSYSQLQRFADAARAYENLTRLVPNDAQLWADYADVQAMANNQSLAGLPTKLINKALELDPNNIKALALAGTAAMDRGDFAAALAPWEKAVKLLPPGSEDARMFESGIQQARDFIAQSKGGKVPVQVQRAATEEKQAAAPAGKTSISGTVTLSNAMKGKAAPDDLVLVLARASEGPKMPLAVIRKQVKDLPLKFTLDDSMAMMPQTKLSNFDKVVVVARVSKSGNAMPQAGDLEGTSAVAKPGATDVQVSIDQIVK